MGTHAFKNLSLSGEDYCNSLRISSSAPGRLTMQALMYSINLADLSGVVTVVRTGVEISEGAVVWVASSAKPKVLRDNVTTNKNFFMSSTPVLAINGAPVARPDVHRLPNFARGRPHP